MQEQEEEEEEIERERKEGSFFQRYFKFSECSCFECSALISASVIPSYWFSLFILLFVCLFVCLFVV